MRIWLARWLAVCCTLLWVAAAEADYDEAVDAIGAGDYARAIELLLPLAEAGDPNAQFTLAFLYDYGQGVAEDPAQAALWYEQAAEADLPVAQFTLAGMYEIGRGVARDLALAFYWYDRAARRLADGPTRDSVAASRDAVADKLTPEQRAQADALAAGAPRDLVAPTTPSEAEAVVVEQSGPPANPDEEDWPVPPREADRAGRAPNAPDEEDGGDWPGPQETAEALAPETLPISPDTEDYGEPAEVPDVVEVEEPAETAARETETAAEEEAPMVPAAQAEVEPELDAEVSAGNTDGPPETGEAAEEETIEPAEAPAVESVEAEPSETSAPQSVEAAESDPVESDPVEAAEESQAAGEEPAELAEAVNADGAPPEQADPEPLMADPEPSMAEREPPMPKPRPEETRADAAAPAAPEPTAADLADEVAALSETAADAEQQQSYQPAGTGEPAPQSVSLADVISQQAALPEGEEADATAAPGPADETDSGLDAGAAEALPPLSPYAEETLAVVERRQGLLNDIAEELATPNAAAAGWQRLESWEVETRRLLSTRIGGESVSRFDRVSRDSLRAGDPVGNVTRSVEAYQLLLAEILEDIPANPAAYASAP